MMTDVAGNACVQIESLERGHVLIAHLAACGVIVDFAQLLPLGLTQTVELQQVYLVQAVSCMKAMSALAFSSLSL